MYKYGFRETTVVLFRKFLHHMFLFTNFVLRHKRFSPDVGVSKNWVHSPDLGTYPSQAPIKIDKNYRCSHRSRGFAAPLPVSGNFSLAS